MPLLHHMQIRGERLKLLQFDAPPSERMTRKESEKDSERPHYYSQFWLDVAAGRKIIGAPRPNDEADMEFEPEPVNDRRSIRGSTAIDDGYAETIAHPEVEPEFDADEFAGPDIEDEEEDVADFAMPVPAAPALDETEIPDVDLTPLADEEEEDFFDEEEEEEDEDDLGWGGARGRKKPKPGRQVKPPKKPTKREPRRGY